MKKILIWLGVVFSDFFYGLAEKLSNHRDAERQVDEYLDRIEDHLNDEEEDVKTEPHIKEDLLPKLEEPELPLIKLDFSKLDAALTELEALYNVQDPYKPEVPPELPPSIVERQAQGPVIKGLDGKVIPISMKDEELPNYLVFKAMFERKFGKFGICPLQLSGQMKDFTCDELYSCLYQIRYVERPEPTLSALYSAVLEVILRGHGEKLEGKSLN